MGSIVLVVAWFLLAVAAVAASSLHGFLAFTGYPIGLVALVISGFAGWELGRTWWHTGRLPESNTTDAIGYSYMWLLFALLAAIEAVACLIYLVVS